MNGLCKILIVDDEYILRNGLKYICDWEKEGFVIIGEANNGEEALEKVEELKPNIVITDIVMPKLDGVNLTKSIKDLNKDIKVLVLSSFSEFEYVKQAFKYGSSDYILKPKATSENLLPILKKMREEIDVVFDGEKIDDFEKLVGILDLALKGESITYENKELLNEYFNKENVCILKMPVNLFLRENTKKKNEINKSVQIILKEELSGLNCIYTIDSNNYTVVFNHDDMRDHELKKIAQNLLNRINEEYPNVLLLESENFTGIDNIYNKNLYLDNLANKTFYFDSKVIINEKELASENKENRENREVKFKLEEFNSKLLGLEFEVCKNITKEYFIELMETKILDEYSVKKFCQNIIYNIINKVEEFELDLSELNINKIRIFKSIDLCISFNEITEIVYKFLDDITRVVRNQMNNKSVLINKVKQYVDENYSFEITLTDIANSLHVDYYYLSHYFKDQTNENLSVYINKVRVEKAKKYLTDNNIPISSVSELVGFSEHNYFSKIFKKYTGVTPSQYKKRVLNNV